MAGMKRGDPARGWNVVDKDLQHIHDAVAAKGDWSGATVIVTGCAGFLGFYFMQFLARQGRKLGVERVIGIDTFLLGKPAWISELAEATSGFVSIHSADIATIQL